MEILIGLGIYVILTSLNLAAVDFFRDGEISKGDVTICMIPIGSTIIVLICILSGVFSVVINKLKKTLTKK